MKTREEQIDVCMLNGLIVGLLVDVGETTRISLKVEMLGG